MPQCLKRIVHNRIIRATFLTLVVAGLTVYGVAELTRFIRAFYGLYAFPQLLGELGLMWLLYVTGMVLVFAIALGKIR